MQEQSWKLLDEKLIKNLNLYCYPDAPLEIIIHSHQKLDFRNYKNNLLKRLYNPKERNKKVVVPFKIHSRKVDIVRSHVMDGRLTVIVHRYPKNKLLTFEEVFKILKKVEKNIGMELSWERPFPRGSC